MHEEMRKREGERELQWGEQDEEGDDGACREMRNREKQRDINND
jgi:hypothetical protein